MINRRHLRIKVMQSAYALILAENDNLDYQERYLKESIERLHQLYIVQLQLLVAVLSKATSLFKHAKNNFIPSDAIHASSTNFIKNQVLQQFKNSIALNELVFDEEENVWETHSEIVEIIWKKIKASNKFESYMRLTTPTYKDDKKFISDIYKKTIAPNDQLFEFYEDQVISWVDDIPFINTWILSNINSLSSTKNFSPDPLFKDLDDKVFALELFRKSILNYSKFEKDIDAKTPNWDTERITKIDKLLMVMSIAEFIHFPSIPTKVSINEYIEIAKDYATPKSSFFINGVLDKLLEDFKKEDRIQKTGRGLM